MTLKGFFTLTEMKDGFTAPGRVEELITVMQKEKDSLVNSVGDTTRQWAAVASSIAATENKECLDLFIRLDGLLFIDRWLKDAQTLSDEISDCFVEDAISALLQAVEKLQVDSNKLASSGICITVKSLLSCKSIKIQDKARALFDSWKAKDVDITSMDVEKAQVKDELRLDTQDPETQSAENDASPTKSSGDQKLEGAQRVENKPPNHLDSCHIISNNTDSNDRCADIVASPAKLESIADNPVKEEVCPSDGVLGCVTAPKQGTSEVISESLKPGSLVEDTKHENKVNTLPETDRSGTIEVTSASAVSDSKVVSSSTDAKAAAENVVKPDNDMEACGVKDESQIKTTFACDADRPVGESSDGKDAIQLNGLKKGEGFVLETSKDQGAIISALENDEDNELRRYRKSERSYLGNSGNFTRSTKNGKTTDLIQQTRDMDLEDGTIDALEVARLVAKEVEIEVGYSEQSGSSTSSYSSTSSGRILGGGIRQHNSPKSINGEHDMEVDGPANQLSATETAPYASGKITLKSAADVESNTKNHTQELESSQVTEDAAREPERNTEKNCWEFDLNQDFSSEDANHQVDTSSNPVSVVSASRAVVCPGMPSGALQFEGSLGWKGSAATSAFRAASPRRVSDGERTLSGGAISSGSQQRQISLDFDLNVAEGGGDNKIINPVLSKQKQILASIPSGESSVKLSPKRSQRLRLDLNQTEDDGVLPASEWKMGVRSVGPQSCQRSPSPASSSSCMQASMRNFDLNDNPSNCNDLSNQPTFLKESSHKASSFMGPPDDTVISILGTKVKKNSFPPQTPLQFLNGRTSDSVMDGNLSRGGPLIGLGPAVPYHQSVFGYNGLAMGPPVSLTSAQVYRPGGPIPYVFDSRGTPFLPQMLGSTAIVPPSYCQTPLVMNMMGGTPGPNLNGPLRPNLDLNSGFANAVEAGNPEPAFFRPLFIPHGQGRPSEEQLRDSFRTLGSGSSGGKRKEPDSGWEFYPTNYKHQQPPHL